jgi:hypothetical protein
MPASATLGETKPHVTGVNMTRTGLATRQIAYRNVGTRARMTARVGADQKIDIDLEVEDARLVPDDTVTLGTDEAGAPLRAMNVVTAHFNGKLEVGAGRAVAAEGVHTTSKSGKQQMLLIVTAQLAEPNEIAAKGSAPFPGPRAPGGPKGP